MGISAFQDTKLSLKPKVSGSEGGSRLGFEVWDGGVFRVLPKGRSKALGDSQPPKNLLIFFSGPREEAKEFPIFGTESLI